MRRPLLGLLLLSSLAGCFNPERHFRDNGLQRVSFEMQCPREQIQITPLDGNQMGVTGCGRRVVYVLVPYAGWVVNSSSGGDNTNGGSTAPPR
jgi:hypothetical protein